MIQQKFIPKYTDSNKEERLFNTILQLFVERWDTLEQCVEQIQYCNTTSMKETTTLHNLHWYSSLIPKSWKSLQPPGITTLTDTRLTTCGLCG